MALLLASCEKLDTSLPAEKEGGEEAVGAEFYTVEDVISGEVADYFDENGEEALPGVWIQGYIVGYASASTVSSAKFQAGDKATNILLADSPFETDYKRCVPVQLSTSTNANKEVRNALNLKSHAENLRKKVRIYGNLETYMAVIGMKNSTKYQFLVDDFDYANYQKETETQEDGTEDPTENSPNDEEEENDENGNGENGGGNEENGGENGENGGGNGGEETPDDFDPLAVETWSVADIRGILTQWFAEKRAEAILGCKVKGYIVGYVRKNGQKLSQTSFSVEAPVETNIVIADTPDETDYNKCIAVQLSTGNTYLPTRQALNLKDHPENLHRCVTVLGTIEKYMGALGVKKTRDYLFDE